MAEGGDTLSRGWVDGAELDLDQECRRLTVGVLARSVLGLDLDGGLIRWESHFAPALLTSRIAVCDQASTVVAADSRRAPRTRGQRLLT